MRLIDLAAWAWLACAPIGAWLASLKGRSVRNGAIVGLVLGPIGLVIIGRSRSLPARRTPVQSPSQPPSGPMNLVHLLYLIGILIVLGAAAYALLSVVLLFCFDIHLPQPNDLYRVIEGMDPSGR